MPRKTRFNPPPGGSPAAASMRPRPDAAENADQPREQEQARWTRFNEAAARCRGKPPRAGPGSPAACGFNEAAARCRGKRHAPRSLFVRPAGFNEAAARCRGKPSGRSAVTLRRRRFNEAAARCRGKRGPTRPRRPARRAGFNEAAARCRGKLASIWDCATAVAASMRPRPDAAENAQRTPGARRSPRAASMRPRPDAAENTNRPCRPSARARRFNEAAARCRGKRVTDQRDSHDG